MLARKRSTTTPNGSIHVQPSLLLLRKTQNAKRKTQTQTQTHDADADANANGKPPTNQQPVVACALYGAACGVAERGQH
jgi:hypothetical protein